MTWLKVDDGLHSHRKVFGLRRRQVKASERVAAIGLWTLAGTWCSENLTDGQVPEHMVDELGGDEQLAAALVRVGLWHPAGHECPDCPPTDGYVFHQWHEDGQGGKRQPTRAEVEDQRSKNAARVSRWRAQKRDGDGVTEDVGNGVTPEGGNGVTNADVTLPPSRPVPSRPPSGPVVSQSHQRDGWAPSDDDLTAWTPTDVPAGVDLAVERRRFREHNAGRWPELRDHRRAWLGWLRSAGERQGRLR